MLLRFDYIHSQAYINDQNIIIEPGVEVFVHLTYSIPKLPSPFFTLAFCVLCGSFPVLAFLSAIFRTTIPIEKLGFLVGSIATPAMVCGALIMAAVKGKLRDLWESEDDWGSRVQKGGVSVRSMFS